MDTETRRLVRERAGARCEYCRLPQQYSDLLHHVEHIVAKHHGGSDDPGNLALACHRCNFHKGPNLTGIDPATGEMAPLFHPRRDRWADHFSFRGARIEGLSASGLTTVQVLAMNDARRLELRSAAIRRAKSSGISRLTCMVSFRLFTLDHWHHRRLTRHPEVIQVSGKHTTRRSTAQGSPKTHCRKVLTVLCLCMVFQLLKARPTWPSVP